MATASTDLDKMRLGSKPFRADPRTGMAIKARPSPKIPPTSAIASDSASTKKSTERFLNPMALRMPSSPVRSRTEMAMVLPVTSSSVKKTTLPIDRMRNSMFPNCFTQLAANWDSVSVFVS